MRTFARSLHVAWLIQIAILRYLGARLLILGRGSDARDALRGRHLAALLEKLGATAIKLGQVLSTRPDLLPPGVIAGLEQLQDKVAPEPFAKVDRTLDEELGERRAAFTAIEERPLAAASVAQVHRGTLESGERVAIKIQRRGVLAQVDRDLFLMGLGARIVDKIPSVHLLSLPGMVERFGAALRAQLDFTEEAANNRRFAANFAETDGVRVPELHDALCTRRVLTMELIDGVRATEPESVGGDRERLAKKGLEAILKMVFDDAFVHADLHPGNIMLTPEGDVVLIDLGLVAEVEPGMRKPWVESFMAISARDGAWAARLFYGYAPSVGNCHYPTFEADVQKYFEMFEGKALGDLEASAVLSGMMSILRRHRVQVDPVFTVVNLAMVVAEGLGKQLNPDLDIIQEATPHLALAAAKTPPGDPPRRPIPGAA